MKKKISAFLALTTLLSTIPLTACDGVTLGRRRENVLRVASWDEYIDEGGEDGTRPMYEEFEDWYFEQTGKKITVEYIPLQDNETMYNKIKMGDEYDLLCPSEYMIIKLAREGKLQAFPQSFFDATIETNYYAKYVSSYIDGVFKGLNIDDTANSFALSDYAAGYMWGTTGFVFNADKLDREIMSDWSALTNPACHHQITVKDNTRDSYFVGLGLYYQDELNALKSIADPDEYNARVTEIMNRTDAETRTGVRKKLTAMRNNLYGLETDEGKTDVALGRLNASYQWSGDAVYIFDLVEEFGTHLNLEYSIPKSSSNLWFDGWTMMKGANVDAATAFINFVSMPENAVRNMEYIGYTSCIAGSADNDAVFEYINDSYCAEDGEETESYDLSYFFGAGHSIDAPKTGLTRQQLFAQYPDDETRKRLAVMKPFDKATNETINRMWIVLK